MSVARYLLALALGLVLAGLVAVSVPTASKAGIGGRPVRLDASSAGAAAPTPVARPRHTGVVVMGEDGASAPVPAPVAAPSPSAANRGGQRDSAAGPTVSRAATNRGTAVQSPAAAPAGTTRGTPGGTTGRAGGTTSTAGTATGTATGTPGTATGSAGTATGTPGTATGSAGTTAGTAADPAASTAEGQVLALVNQERAKAGCGAVTASSGLASLARAHSADMRDRNFFDHTNPDGLDPFQRGDRAGVQVLAENIAKGQADATAVMTAWMSSPGHRSNILNCSLRHLGVGVAYGAGGPWWTQDFS